MKFSTPISKPSWAFWSQDNKATAFHHLIDLPVGLVTPPLPRNIKKYSIWLPWLCRSPVQLCISQILENSLFCAMQVRPSFSAFFYFVSSFVLVYSMIIHVFSFAFVFYRYSQDREVARWRDSLIHGSAYSLRILLCTLPLYNDFWSSWLIISSMSL